MTIRQLRALAAHMGIPFADLIRRRARLNRPDVFADSEACLHFRPPVYVSRHLPEVRVSTGRGIASFN